jgi:hypothetical protein
MVPIFKFLIPIVSLGAFLYILGTMPMTWDVPGLLLVWIAYSSFKHGTTLACKSQEPDPNSLPKDTAFAPEEMPFVEAFVGKLFPLALPDEPKELHVYLKYQVPFEPAPQYAKIIGHHYIPNSLPQRIAAISVGLRDQFLADLNFPGSYDTLSPAHLSRLVAANIKTSAEIWNIKNYTFELRPQENKAHFDIPYAIRNQHVYIPGKTRHGKSTLFLHIALRDIVNGHGLCVLDPKGDLVKKLVHLIPAARKDDCIYLDLTNPVPIDLFGYANDEEKEALVGEIKYLVMKDMSSEHAPLMNAILDSLVYTLLNYNENVPPDERATFLDIHDFLQDSARRDHIKGKLTDARLKARWEHLPTEKERAPIVSRMTPFVNSTPLRKIFGCPNPPLKLSEVMDTKKILLVDLGGITEPKKIFGALLIAKIKQAAQRRANTPESERVPFFLFADEFQFFQTSDFDDMLSFAGGYGLRLTLGNQFTGQLDSNIRRSIFGNVGTFITFCLSGEDAHYFKNLIAPLTVQQLETLSPHHAMFKVGAQPAIIKATPPPPPYSDASYAEYIKKRTVDKYSCNTPQVSHTEVNDHSNKPDEIAPDTNKPSVPSHQSKKGNT